jgi:hypothetical protein
MCGKFYPFAEKIPHFLEYRNIQASNALTPERTKRRRKGAACEECSGVSG